MSLRRKFVLRKYLLLVPPLILVVLLWLLYTSVYQTSLVEHQIELISTTVSSAARLRALFQERELASARQEFARIPSTVLTNKLFYNRVPKCGSSSVRLLMQLLAKLNNFTHISSDVLDDWFLGSLTQQRDFVREFVALRAHDVAAVSYDRHLYFVDFEKFGLSAPLYMNLVREPAARFVSQFHFLRHNALKDAANNNVSNTYYELDLLRCLQKRSNDDCLLDEGRYFKLGLVGFFCGQELDCLQVNSRRAMETAKNNVIKFYQVVGIEFVAVEHTNIGDSTGTRKIQILEDMNTTLRVLEHRLPQFFRGATSEYYRHTRSGIHENELNRSRSSKLSTIAPEVLQILKRNLSTEFEFYDFLRERLRQQSANLKR